jgi:hypothetical protein
VRFVRSTLTAISDSTIDFTTVYYVTSPSYQLFVDTQQAVLLEIMRRLAQEKVQLGVQVEAAYRDAGPRPVTNAAGPPLRT